MSDQTKIIRLTHKDLEELLYEIKSYLECKTDKGETIIVSKEK